MQVREKVGKSWNTVFSRMRSKGSRFTLVVWGFRMCSLDVAFTFATARNRSQPFAWGPYGRAYGKFCRRGAFYRFQTSGCFVSRGRCGTSWHSDVFCNVLKVVLCGRHNTFASATSVTPATPNAGRCLQVPRLPRQTQVDISKCHAYHVKRRWMSPSATPATQSAAASPAPATPSVCERWCVCVHC